MSLLARLTAGERRRRDEPGELIDDGWSLKGAWRWFAALLADYQWYILAVAGVVAFILGYIGWWHFLPVIYPQNRPVNVSDAAYWSFKDFLMNSPGQPGLPVELDVARFLAPIVAGWAGLSTLGLLFRDRVQQMRIPLMRGHVVMCGLGKYVGLVFLRHLRDKRIRVVVIEKDGTNPNIELCRSLGVPVIVGDAQRLKTLQAAGSRRASRVLAVTDDDGVNTQIVATWRELPRRRSRPLGCLARIADPEFCSLLRIQEATRGDAEMSADFFNIDEIGARLLLGEFPIGTDCGQPHILVAHLDPLGVWLVYHAARAWCENREENAKLMVTVLDKDPDERVKALEGQHPELKSVCDFHKFQATAEDIHERLRDHHLNTVTPHISRAYVTAYGDQLAFETALKLHQELHKVHPAVPVVVALSRPHGMAGLVGDVKKSGALAHVEVFPTMERACTVELVRGGSFEPIAELIHERWRREQIKVHKPAPLWNELDESRKESSRAQARHIAVKLRMAGYAVAPLRDFDAESFEFSDNEVEILAEAEHDRWNQERIADGWTLASTKNVDRKETPYLVSWPDLLRDFPDIAEWDRVFVREIPKLLASVGLQVIRTTAAPTPPRNAEVPSDPVASASDLRGN